jgi:hypothetical protein
MRCSGVFQHNRHGRGTTLEQWGVSAMEILTVGPAGEIELPDEVRDRYGMAPATPVRISRPEVEFCSSR